MTFWAIFRRNIGGESYSNGSPVGSTEQAQGWFSRRVRRELGDLHSASGILGQFSTRPEGVTEELHVDLRDLGERVAVEKPIRDRQNPTPLKLRFEKPVGEGIDLAEFCGTVEEDGEYTTRNIQKL